MIYFDRRWEGENGIGRFCREVRSRIGCVQDLPIKGNPTSPFDVVKLSIFMLLNPHAVVFSPGYTAPLIGLDRFIFTVHDLNHIDVPENSSWVKRLYYKVVLRRACRAARTVFTVSEFSKSRIKEWSGAVGSNIVCVGNGVSSAFNDCEKNDVTRDAFGGYLFSVGNRKVHKNERASVRALASLSCFPHLRLIFSGLASSALAEEIEAQGLTERVEFAGSLSESELCQLYQGAVALLFPSLYEGFGLPAVEAMAVGCPVIASNTTALEEVAGGAAIGVNPLNDIDIARGIASVVKDVGVRRDAQILGVRRASQYSWDGVASVIERYLLAERPIG